MPRLTLQLICDDVRVENNGKLIIIGLYVETVVVPELPVSLALTFLQIYKVDDVRPFRVNLHLSGPNGNIGEPVPMNFEVRAAGPVIGLAKISERFETPGEYRLTVTDSEGEVLPNPDGTSAKTFVILSTQSVAGRG